jgi:hypothetical protein
MTSISKIARAKRTGAVAKAVEILLCKHKALSPIQKKKGYRLTSAILCIPKPKHYKTGPMPESPLQRGQTFEVHLHRGLFLPNTWHLLTVNTPDVTVLGSWRPQGGEGSCPGSAKGMSLSSFCRLKRDLSLESSGLCSRLQVNLLHINIELNETRCSMYFFQYETRRVLAFLLHLLIM